MGALMAVVDPADYKFLPAAQTRPTSAPTNPIARFSEQIGVQPPFARRTQPGPTVRAVANMPEDVAARYRAIADREIFNRVPGNMQGTTVPFEGKMVPKDLILNALGWYESNQQWNRDDNPDSTASGMWQFVDGTDQWVANELGLRIYDDEGKRIRHWQRTPAEQEAMTLWLLSPESGRGPQHWAVLEDVRRQVENWEKAQRAGRQYVGPWGEGIDFSYRSGQSAAQAGARQGTI